MTDQKGHVAFFDCEVSPVVVDEVLEVCAARDFEFMDAKDTPETVSGGLKRYLTYETWQPRITIYSGEDVGPEFPDLDVSLNRSLKLDAFEDVHAHHRWMDAVFYLVCRLSMFGNPAYAPLYFTSSPDRTLPDDRPIAQSVEKPPCFGVYSPDVLADFGGTDELFQHEPWCVVELTNERTIIIGSPTPWNGSSWQPPTSAEFIEHTEFHTRE